MTMMRLVRDVHCRFPEAVQAVRVFALLHGESNSTVSASPRIEYICEPLFNEAVADAMPLREVFFVHWVCSPPFQLPALFGIVSAAANGLTTTVAFDVIYEPDTGIIGALFERWVGRRFAKGAAAAFFRQLLRFVEREAGLDNLLDRLLGGGRSTGLA